MEIQDRNNLLQVLVGAKEGKMSFAFDKGSFVDILNSAQVDVEKSVKIADNADLGCGAKRDVVFEVKENKETFVNNKATSKKVENKDSSSSKEVKSKEKEDVKENVKEKEVSKDEKAKVKEEDAIAAVQGVKESETVTPKDEVVDVQDAENLGVEEIVLDEILLPQDVLVSDTDVQISGEELLNNTPIKETAVEDVAVVSAKVSAASVYADNNTVVVSDKTDELVTVAEAKVAETEGAKTLNESFVPVSEGEALLVEQAKYFDEKVAPEKKLKIEVKVSEEKIAEPVIKDVLKNRFEIDSMFQMVNDELPIQDVEAEVILDDIVQNVADDSQVVSDVNNVVYSEVKLAQETVNIAVSKDVALSSVAGKEVVAEVANVSRSETFVKINETAVRDNYKGMSKEVIEQIKVNITKSAIKGVDTVDIQLKPEDLGKVQIKMYIGKDGKVQAEIVASRAETADMLQKDASTLSKAFNDAGYDTDAKSFTFSFQNENQARGQEKGDSGLLKFIGDTLEQEAENIAGNDNIGYDPVLGLNIRV